MAFVGLERNAELASESGSYLGDFSGIDSPVGPINRAMSPKELAAAINDVRSVRWICFQCAEYTRTGGKVGFRTVTGRQPYLIPAEESARIVARFNGSEARA
jgi:hypothetical protein